MGGMRGYGGKRPDGEQPDGSASAEVFGGKTLDRKSPDGNEAPKKPMVPWLREQVIQRKHNKAKRYRRGYLTEG